MVYATLLSHLLQDVFRGSKLSRWTAPHWLGRNGGILFCVRSGPEECEGIGGVISNEVAQITQDPLTV